MKPGDNQIQLHREGGRVLLTRNPDAEAIPVRLAWLRPVSGRRQEVSILDAERRQELVMLEHLDVLDAASRRIAEEELERRYLVPRITRVVKTEVNYGNRYLEVETDRGYRKFLVKNPNTCVVPVTDDRMLIRDVLGNRYEIESLAGLDAASRAALDRIL